MSTPMDAPPFLSAGGDMGTAMRSFPWGDTPMGPPTSWPQSLRTALSIMLRAHYPINVYWGESFTNFYNDAYLPIIGRKHPAALGQPLQEVWPEVWPSIEAMLGAVREKGESFHAENVQQFVTRSGFSEEIFMSFSYTPIFTERGVIGGVFAAGTEVTGAVVGQRRLRLLRDLGSRTAGVDEPAKACRAMAEVLGGYREDVPFSALYLRERPADGPAGWRLAATSGFPEEAPAPSTLPEPMAPLLAEVEARFVEAAEAGLAFPTGPWEEAPRQAIVAPLRPEADSEPLALMVAGASSRRTLDDTYRDFFGLLVKQSERALSGAHAIAVARERQRELERLDRAKTEFLSTVSHEFRTPLTLILGPLESLEAREGLSVEGYRAVEAARLNAQRLLRLVTNLLEYSRLQLGSAGASFAPTDLARLTEWASSLFQSTVEHAGLSFRLEIEPLAEPVHVDRRLWDHILFNLLSNALKFTRRGGVTVRLREDDGDPRRRVLLEVEDTGVGIPESLRPRIFERFVHSSAPGARSVDGVGIGLALVQELVELHGGTISFDSEVARGTRFSVRLPYGSSHLDPSRVTEAPAASDPTALADAHAAEAELWMPQGEEALAKPEHKADGFRHRVLVVDDNRGMREYLRAELGEDFAVRTAADASKAETLLAEFQPDCIVTDVMMPEVDGIEWVARLRADPNTSLVPIILLSARADEPSRLAGLSAGADDYLAKPFSAEELRARVRRQVLGLAERARRERALRLKAEAADRAKSAFLANMSHEIRTPLTPILLSAAAAASRTNDERTVQALRRIENAGRRLAKMLDGLLTLARLEVGQRRESEAVPVARLAAEVVESLGGEGLSPEVALHLETTEAGASAEALAQTGAVSSILQNLVSNALKFTERGSVLVRVDTGAFDPTDGDCEGGAPQAVHVHVQDTGIGITPEFMPSLFELFTQESEGWSRSHEGSGIELALTKRLLDAIGGRIHLESEKGVGTHVVVSLPLHVPGQSLDDKHVAVHGPEGRRAQVLLVEDQDDTREMIKDLLEDHFEVTAVAHSGEAIEAATHRDFDVVALDIHLGRGESGVDLLHVLRSLPRQRSPLPALALTAYALPGDEEKLLAAGFDAYLPKPCEPERIISVLRSLGG